MAGTINNLFSKDKTFFETLAAFGKLDEYGISYSEAYQLLLSYVRPRQTGNNKPKADSGSVRHFCRQGSL